ncbi:MAG: UDP-glucose 4-epimerase [Candidatus Harrisonbacteria bacterium CG10_big_fil_rev_8_21_14_0_10_45_28]|uniref:UDP-glucose 4-epimerase n=1 Tax=Candidatus Harrisonbacteria bacterium CG10_big_fil_rev_8_21_14_0_10_45_28 TaxID=1974586 RepID=A0A2H0UQ94_9BACT|nr:MAG: UDP-glucose 4-epimerase [Candidatus Harrisonbacteria bacterium CG10_big_fil_rev_8_21_14_0_10_45_28]
MRILVTGGAGFIASHIVDAYILVGHDVAVIDNLSTGSEKNLNPKAKFYNVDIRNHGEVAKVFEDFEPEVVNHHAALVSVVDSVKGAVETYEINVMGTINLLEQCGAVKRFIFSSTGGAMYGLEAVLADESWPNPISNYGVSKLLGEQLIQFYAKEKEFEFVIFRYANVFGPRQNPHGEAGVVAIFSKLLSTGQTPTVYDKDATRDYVFVGDVVKANLLALDGGAGQIMNLGRGQEITNADLFSQMAKLYGFTNEAKFSPARPGEVRRVSLDVSRAKKVLGWQANTDFATGIELVKSDYGAS